MPASSAQDPAVIAAAGILVAFDLPQRKRQRMLHAAAASELRPSFEDAEAAARAAGAEHAIRALLALSPELTVAVSAIRVCPDSSAVATDALLIAGGAEASVADPDAVRVLSEAFALHHSASAETAAAGLRVLSRVSDGAWGEAFRGHSELAERVAAAAAGLARGSAAALGPSPHRLVVEIVSALLRSNQIAAATSAAVKEALNGVWSADGEAFNVLLAAMTAQAAEATSRECAAAVVHCISVMNGHR